MNGPPRFSKDQLELWRQQSTELFRKSRLDEPLEAYGDAFDEYRSAVETLLEETTDLARLRDKAVDVLASPTGREIVRYLAGPPISEDDLNTLVGVKSLNPRQIKEKPELAREIVDLVMNGLDQRRFPWVRDGQEPTEAEKLAAVIASSALLANRKVATARRHDGKEMQELAVCQMLKEIGWKEVARKKFTSVEDAPKPGEYCRETIVGSKKADVLVRLHDRRLMPVECKVSNSGLNSIKRLSDAEGKATLWTKDFGAAWVVPAAVLSGVFALKDLVATQERGLTLFWGHDLPRMADWIKSATVSTPKPPAGPVRKKR